MRKPGKRDWIVTTKTDAEGNVYNELIPKPGSAAEEFVDMLYAMQRPPSSKVKKLTAF